MSGYTRSSTDILREQQQDGIDMPVGETRRSSFADLLAALKRAEQRELDEAAAEAAQDRPMKEER